MPDVNDMELMQEYADRDSEAAFAGLVQRHIHLVYSVAWRYVGNSQDAQDVTQAVFIILAQNVARLRQRPTLTGWLYETTRFTAARLLRTRARRQAREQAAYMRSTLNDPETDGVWRQLAPLLEEAMARLNEKERALLAMRFFENKSGAETAALLGIQEAAAHKRASRALEKLRKFFAKRGVGSTTTLIAGAISAHSVQAAPLALAESVTAVAITNGAAASGSILTLIKGALKLMAWTTAKKVAVVGTGVLLAAATASLTIKAIQNHGSRRWQIRDFYSRRIWEKVPPQVTIVPTKFPGPNGSTFVDGKTMGIGQPIDYLLLVAYGRWEEPEQENLTSARMVFTSEIPQGRYDFIANLSSGSLEALQQKIKQRFGLIGIRETRETDVLFLRVKSPNPPGLQPNPNANQPQKNFRDQGRFTVVNRPISDLAKELESNLDMFQLPVIDQTGLAGAFDFDLKWKATAEKRSNLNMVKQALADQLGLELVPGRAKIEMLVVTRVPP